MELFLKEKKRLHTITIYKPEIKSWSKKIEIDRTSRQYYVTETAWDIIRERTKSKCHFRATSIEEQGDNLLIFLSIPKPEQKAEKPSD